jgi:hypothetical protein
MIIKNVCRTIAQTRSGLLPLVHENDPKKRKAKRITKLTTGSEEIKDLVNDPDSPEAELLVYLFETYVPARGTPEHDVLFDAVTDVEIRRATNLLKAKELFDTLIADDENLDLGRVNPGGRGRIQRLEGRADANHTAAMAVVAPNSPLPFLEAEAKQREDMAKLERRKGSLRTSLTKVQSYLSQVDPACGWTTPAAIRIAAEDIENAMGHPSLNMTVRIRGKDQSARDWMRSDDLKTRADTVVQRYRLYGTDAPSASAVLDEFIRMQYGPRLHGMPDADKDRFYQELKNTLLSGVAASAAAPGAAPASAPAASGGPASAPSGQPGLFKRATRGVGSYLSDFIFGAK